MDQATSNEITLLKAEIYDLHKNSMNMQNVILDIINFLGLDPKSPVDSSVIIEAIKSKGEE